MSWLINAAQLGKFRKNQKNVVILDATWYPATPEKNAYQDFLQQHIPGARFFDSQKYVDLSSQLPNMLIHDEKKISALLGALGITNDHKIIFYDNSPMHTSCRALWMFKMFGHNPFQLSILDGGYQEWEKFGGKAESGEANCSAKTYHVSMQPQYLRTLQQMKENIRHPREQVIDTRHAVRFVGGPEPRAGLRAGHIPGSFCLPSSTLFEVNGYWKPVEKIRKQLIGLGIELTKPIVTTCGSATTAPIVNFALDLIDPNAVHAVYDGSWTEWAAEQLYPGEVSLEERPVVTSLE